MSGCEGTAAQLRVFLHAGPSTGYSAEKNGATRASVVVGGANLLVADGRNLGATRYGVCQLGEYSMKKQVVYSREQAEGDCAGAAVLLPGVGARVDRSMP